MDDAFKIERVEPPFNPLELKECCISEGREQHPNFFESDSLPGKVIRSEAYETLSCRHNRKIDVLTLFETAKKLFKEFEEKCCIIIPADFYLHKDIEGEDIVYSVVDRIEGKHFNNAEITSELTSKVESLYGAIARYFLEKLQSGDMYLWDVNNPSQYIYGNRMGLEEKDIFFIDTDLWIGNSRSGLCLSVYWLTRHMSSLEKRFGRKFETARENIKQFIMIYSEDPGDGEDQQQVKAILDFLENRPNEYSIDNAIPDFV